jgi:hypothetical protein
MTTPPWTPDQPDVCVTADHDGALTVELRGSPYALPDTGMGRRDQMGHLLDHFCQLLGVPFQARVVEADGTVHQGWVPDQRAAELAPPAPKAAAQPGYDGRHVAAPPAADGGAGEPVLVGGEGFIPGEQVAFAVVVAETAAQPDGTALIELPTGYIRELPCGEIALIGRVSGTLAVRQPGRQL